MCGDGGRKNYVIDYVNNKGAPEGANVEGWRFRFCAGFRRIDIPHSRPDQKSMVGTGILLTTTSTYGPITTSRQYTLAPHAPRLQT